MYKESLYPKGSQEALEVEKATAKGKSYDANIACKYKKMKYARDKKTDEHSCWEVFDCSNVKKFNFGGHALDGGEYLFRCDATAKDKQGCNDVSLSQCNPISYQSQSTFEQIGKGLTGYQPPIIDVRNRR